MVDYKNLPIGDRAPEIVNAVVEIPSGSSNKYGSDVGLGMFRLDRVLYSPVHYPADYGFTSGGETRGLSPLFSLLLGLAHPIALSFSLVIKSMSTRRHT